jgi:hypothetical protein
MATLDLSLKMFSPSPNRNGTVHNKIVSNNDILTGTINVLHFVTVTELVPVSGVEPVPAHLPACISLIINPAPAHAQQPPAVNLNP